MHFSLILCALFIASTQTSPISDSVANVEPSLFNQHDQLDLETQEPTVSENSEPENLKTPLVAMVEEKASTTTPVERHGYRAPKAFSCPGFVVPSDFGFGVTTDFCGFHNGKSFYVCERNWQHLCYLGHVVWPTQWRSAHNICAYTPSKKVCIVSEDPMISVAIDDSDDPIWQQEAPPKKIQQTPPSVYFQNVDCSLFSC